MAQKHWHIWISLNDLIPEIKGNNYVAQLFNIRNVTLIPERVSDICILTGYGLNWYIFWF